jgi:hypothetical protein
MRDEELEDTALVVEAEKDSVFKCGCYSVGDIENDTISDSDDDNDYYENDEFVDVCVICGENRKI